MNNNPKISYALPIGSTLKNGKYTILKVIGAGGMGITYLAKRKTDEIFDEIEQVVIKELFITPNNTTAHCTRNHQNNLTVIPEGKLNETFDKFKKRFFDEAKTLHKFRSLDGMVQVKDLFEENGTVYFTMQYIDGQNLHDFVAQKGKLSIKETLNYLTKIAKLLHGIHQENFLHRDVKPENILIDKNGNAYLIDFGIAKCYDEMGIVKTLTAMGTKRYAPPEQLAGKKELITTALDVFGLANTFYYCLTGTPPQTRDELDIEGYKQIKDFVNISNTVNNIIEKGRKRNPKERTQNALNFINALLNEVDGKTETPQKPDITEKPDNENTIIEQPDNEITQIEDETVLTNKPAEWFNSPERRASWWIQLDDRWKKIFNDVYLRKKNTITIPADNVLKLMIKRNTLYSDNARLYMNDDIKEVVSESFPRMIFRETIESFASSSYTHKRVFAGAGEFAEVHLTIKRYYNKISTKKEDEIIKLPWGGNVEFHLFYGTTYLIPDSFKEAIKYGIMKEMLAGPLTRSPIKDISVTIDNINTHPIDSNEVSFKKASAIAFRQAFMKAKPTLLEPIVEITYDVPEKELGNELTRLQSLRSLVIKEIKAVGNFDKITARVPLTEMMGFFMHNDYSVKLISYDFLPEKLKKRWISYFKKDKRTRQKNSNFNKTKVEEKKLQEDENTIIENTLISKKENLLVIDCPKCKTLNVIDFNKNTRKDVNYKCSNCGNIDTLPNAWVKKAVHVKNNTYVLPGSKPYSDRFDNNKMKKTQNNSTFTITRKDLYGYFGDACYILINGINKFQLSNEKSLKIYLSQNNTKLTIVSGKFKSETIFVSKNDFVTFGFTSSIWNFGKRIYIEKNN